MTKPASLSRLLRSGAVRLALAASLAGCDGTTVTVTALPTQTSTAAPPTATPTQPPPPSNTPQATNTGSPPIATATAVASSTRTATVPISPTRTATQAEVATRTGTATVAAPSVTSTVAPPTASSTATVSSTPTLSSTATASIAAPTASSTATATLPPTATATVAAPATTSATATATPPANTATATFSASPTATPTPMSSAICGNMLLEPGETCQTCAPDCVVQACTPTTTTAAFTFDLVAPPGQSPTGATILLGYRSDILNIPGSGSQSSVLQRIVAPSPAPVPFIRNDQNYAISIVLGRSTPITELFTVTFDRCQGAPAPSADDVACAVAGCASGGPPIDGCACSVRTP